MLDMRQESVLPKGERSMISAPLFLIPISDNQKTLVDKPKRRRIQLPCQRLNERAQKKPRQSKRARSNANKLAQLSLKQFAHPPILRLILQDSGSRGLGARTASRAMPLPERKDTSNTHKSPTALAKRPTSPDAGHREAIHAACLHGL